MDSTNLLDTLDEHLLMAAPQPLPDEPETAVDYDSPYLPLAAHRPSSNSSPWDPRLVMDLALEIDSIPDILLRYNLTLDDYHLLCTNQAFRRDLAVTIKEVKDNGLTFQHKARVQAEHYLSIVDDLVHSLDTPASVKMDAIKSTVSWGRLDPKQDKGSEAGTNATQINVNINF